MILLIKRHIPRSELLFVSETDQISVDGQSVDEPDRSAQLEMLAKNRIDVFQKQSRGDGNLLFQNPVTGRIHPWKVQFGSRPHYCKIAFCL